MLTDRQRHVRIGELLEALPCASLRRRSVAGRGGLAEPREVTFRMGWQAVVTGPRAGDAAKNCYNFSAPLTTGHLAFLLGDAIVNLCISHTWLDLHFVPPVRVPNGVQLVRFMCF